MKQSKLAMILLAVCLSSVSLAGACSGAKVEDSSSTAVDVGADAAGDAAVDAPADAGGVVINEVTSNGDDKIELLNTSSTPIDLSGWYVVDDAYDPATGEPADHRFEFDSGTTIAAGEYMVLVKDQDHTFGLGKDDAVRLFDADDNLVDTADWPDQSAETSWCRIPDGTGDFQACDPATFGESND